MNIIPLSLGSLQTNCYLIWDTRTRECLIIDPADEADFISTTILENKLIPVGIILTHGHYDHCLAVLELKLIFNVPIYLHQDDNFLYKNTNKSAKYHSKLNVFKSPPVDFFLEDNQTITFGESFLNVIHTPGHTPGSICLSSVIPDLTSSRAKSRDLIPPVITSFGIPNRSDLTPPILFTGDTLFADGVGRTDLSYSSKPDQRNSLKKIYNLPPDTLIYPGHELFGVPISNLQTPETTGNNL